jgi:hypothetical protein
MQMACVLCEVRTGIIYIIFTDLLRTFISEETSDQNDQTVPMCMLQTTRAATHKSTYTTCSQFANIYDLNLPARPVRSILQADYAGLLYDGNRHYSIEMLCVTSPAQPVFNHWLT